MKFTKVDLPYHFEENQIQGLTNDLLILNQKYFVKRSKTITKTFISWENQLNVINLIKNQTFTLPILEAKIETEKLWVLMPYYQNLTTLASHKIDPHILEQLANLIKELHAIKIDNNKIITWNPLKQLNLYCNLIKPESNVKNKVNDIKKELESWLKSYQPEKIVLSHNDLIVNNFVNDGKRWYLIDWDFATLNDQLFDIASFVSETLTDKTNIKYWYQLFKISQEELKIVNHWIKYQNLIWYYWALFLFQKTTNPIYQRIANEKMKMLSN